MALIKTLDIKYNTESIIYIDKTAEGYSTYIPLCAYKTSEEKLDFNWFNSRSVTKVKTFKTILNPSEYNMAEIIDNMYIETAVKPVIGDYCMFIKNINTETLMPILICAVERKYNNYVKEAAKNKLIIDDSIIKAFLFTRYVPILKTSKIFEVLSNSLIDMEKRGIEIITKLNSEAIINLITDNSIIKSKLNSAEFIKKQLKKLN